MDFTEKELELIIRECYASALEASAKMRERMAVDRVAVADVDPSAIADVEAMVTGETV